MERQRCVNELKGRKSIFHSYSSDCLGDLEMRLLSSIENFHFLSCDETPLKAAKIGHTNKQ